MEKIIEQRDGKKTRRKTYPEYLVKWNYIQWNIKVGSQNLIF
jgi:hypothetical protein